MPLAVELQIESIATDIPSAEDFEYWAASALQQPQGALTIRIVDHKESQILNRNYRGDDNPTNVLSFPFEAPEHLPSQYLGDLIICAPVVTLEVGEQSKSVTAHWAHMVIHGMLHLQGYDHQTSVQAEAMEQLEQEIMADLGYPDPYVVNNNTQILK
ncbi:MAG: rRNA maturation RNase YbeY [Gammaproteobacteria bacterium]|nr:rRNA maturation RNase YbeY [Gammaproteobacteria bacterium]